MCLNQTLVQEESLLQRLTNPPQLEKKNTTRTPIIQQPAPCTIQYNRGHQNPHKSAIQYSFSFVSLRPQFTRRGGRSPVQLLILDTRSQCAVANN
jgi:hypothetical protein